MFCLSKTRLPAHPSFIKPLPRAAGKKQLSFRNEKTCALPAQKRLPEKSESLSYPSAGTTAVRISRV